jgi:hypothetical protein
MMRLAVVKERDGEKMRERLIYWEKEREIDREREREREREKDVKSGFSIWGADRQRQLKNRGDVL